MPIDGSAFTAATALEMESRIFLIMNSETNKVIRVLQTGSPRMKFTVRVNLPDGKAIEWQSDHQPKVEWNDSDRKLWLKSGAYSEDAPIMPWPDGAIMITERNKDVKD